MRWTADEHLPCDERRPEGAHRARRSRSRLCDSPESRNTGTPHFNDRPARAGIGTHGRPAAASLVDVSRAGYYGTWFAHPQRAVASLS